ITFGHLSFVCTTYREYSFEGIPGIFFQLLMTESQLACLFVYAQDNHIYLVTYFSELVRVIVTLDPAQVADVYHTTNTGLQFNKHTVRSDVLHCTFVAAF